MDWHAKREGCMCMGSAQADSLDWWIKQQVPPQAFKNNKLMEMMRLHDDTCLAFRI